MNAGKTLAGKAFYKAAIDHFQKAVNLYPTDQAALRGLNEATMKAKE